MAERRDRPRWLSEAGALSIIALVSAVLAGLLIVSYLQYILLAIVLAYVLMPLQYRLENRVSATTAAVVLISLTFIAILIPAGYLFLVAIQQGLEVISIVHAEGLSPDGIEDRLETIGYGIDLELIYTTLEGPITTAIQGLAVGALVIVGGLPGILIGLTVTVFVLFALLRDGDRLVAWQYRVLPINTRAQRDILEALDRLMWASVVGNVAVAAIQAILLGIGLAILGMPGIIFFTVATFLLALLPIVGAFGVWVPVSIYLFAIGRPIAAVALVLYGSLVSVSDMYLRPAIISKSGAINVAIIVVGIFGGLIVFGAIGLFVGPVVLAGSKVVLDAFARERSRARET